MTTNWREYAACQGIDLAVFFPDGRGPSGGESNPAAEAICNRCPVRRDLCRAQAAVMREQHAEYANVRAMLRKLVTAVTGRWEDDLPEVGQAMEALRQLRRVERYLLSQQHDQEEVA